MAETLLSFGVQKLWDLLVRESDRFKGVDEKLTEIKSDLNLLRSFLKDADVKKHASAMVRNCVEEIKEIVLDAEDVIETYLLKEELRKTSGVKKCLMRHSCIVVDRMVFASEMGGVTKRISKVIRDLQSFGVQQMILDGGNHSHPVQERQREIRHTFPSDNESNFVGLEQNVKKLVGYLVDEECTQVVSICGMGGIGKTTLARQVFNHERVKNSCDGVVWVCVSQQFTRKYVWGTILQTLSSEHDEHRVSNMTEDELQNILFRLLETSKSLIVLDDMWKDEDWDRIKTVFPPTKGWKLLLTSRNEGVALRVDPTCIIFKPECLTTEESWTLFRKIAFPVKDTTKYKVDELEEIGKEMIKHCGGLPLAVRVLGGLLAAQYTLHEWKRIYENIGSHIVGGTSFNDRNISSVYHVLSLSFEELPIYLKHCFLYFAHYPEDHAIDVGELSYYWAAEGIQKPMYHNGASIRDMSDGYIAELVKRNMVISRRDACTSRFETCQLHDMMREVCLRKAEEENFVKIVHDSSTANSKSPCKSRRLAIHRFEERYYMEGKMKNPKLRSLMFIVKSKMEIMVGIHLSFTWLQLTRLQLMRVLDLSHVKFKGEKLPSSIGNLIHLRYLSLSRAWVSYLPYSLENLKLLLYLNLHVCGGSSVYVPNVLKEMRELKYLELPIDMHGKTKLELGNLVNLETLEWFSTEHGSVTDLQGMTRLRALSINIRGKGCTVETLFSSLSQLKHLENLTMYAPIYEEEGIVPDCINLRKPKLSFYMPRLPDEQHFPSHLSYISLCYCRFEEDPMLVLEKLLQLKEVHLESWKSGRKMVCSAGGFSQLHKLVLSELKGLEEWIVEEGSMPLLHNLSIHQCQKLKELPDGLRFITSLKVLRMGNQWKKRLSEGGEDYNKVQHIPSLEFGGRLL